MIIRSLSLFILMASAPLLAFAQASSDPVESAAREASTTAPGRNSEPEPAPWLVHSPTALFDRPTLQEAFKVSAAVTDKGSEYSMAIAPTSFFGYPTWWSEGLQAHLAYNPSTKTLSYGGKWSVDGRDPRLLSDAQRKRIDEARRAAFDSCLKPDASNMAGCQNEEHEVILRGLNSIAAPAVSLAVSGQQDFENDQFGDFAANLALAYTRAVVDPVWSLVANGDLQRTAPPAAGGSGSWDWRVGVQGLYNFDVLDAPVQIGVGAKFVRCFDNCTGDRSSVLFGPSIAITLAKDTQIGAVVSWKGSGSDMSHAFTSLAISYSFDSPFNQK